MSDRVLKVLESRPQRNDRLVSTGCNPLEISKQLEEEDQGFWTEKSLWIISDQALENKNQHLVKVTVEALEDLQDVRHHLSILLKELGSFLPEAIHKHRIGLGLIHQQF